MDKSLFENDDILLTEKISFENNIKGSPQSSFKIKDATESESCPSRQNIED